METIIENLKQEKAIKNKEYLTLLNEVGFPKIICDYPIITPEAIREYLLKCVIKINPKINPKKFFVEGPTNSGRYYTSDSCEWRYCKNLSWEEYDISEFCATPPLHVLENIKKAKNDFDCIKIVTVDEYKDPLVLGANKDSQLRYLIDWWDKDIKIEDLNIL